MGPPREPESGARVCLGPSQLRSANPACRAGGNVSHVLHFFESPFVGVSQRQYCAFV